MDSTPSPAEMNRAEQTKEASYHQLAQIEIGEVVVYDRHEGRDVVQYKAMGAGHSVISDSPMDAVMGLVQKIRGDDLL